MAGINNKAFMKRLEQLREDVQRNSELTENERKPVALDQSMVGRLSRMDAIQGQAMAIETDRRRALELIRLDSALARLDAGEYGACVRCGEEIAAKRLNFDPAVTLCVDCASEG